MRTSHGTRLLVALVAAITVWPAATGHAADRYSLVHGCYDVKGAQGGPFRMQATDLGSYLLYSKDRTFLSAGGSGLTLAAEPSQDADWVVKDAGGDTFTLTTRSGKAFPGGAVTFATASGCAVYPEAEVNVTGEPQQGATPYSTTRGYIDAHMHMMGFEFLGGDIKCGRPWHPFGAPYALPDCSKTNAANNLGTETVETVLKTDNTPGDPVGWPTFKDWPRHDGLTHEQSYYKGLERSWRAGQRLYVNLFVENHALCTIYPQKRNSCNEMESVRLQAKDIRILQDYIDAQNGGPGKGWFRIVTTPQQARRVINSGKMAIVLGIEVSNLFDCGLNNGTPTPNCTPAEVDRQLDAAYKLGVRDMELINKFDNGFAGVAGDNGSVGLIVNQGNKFETGQYWNLETCKGPAEQSDHEQLTLPGTSRDSLLSGLAAFLPMGQLPVYPAGPHCNVRGLTQVGEYLVNAMMKRNMVLDPDHLSVRARQHVLSILEAKNYGGIVSSHSWSTDDAYPRILKLGGVVTPYAGDSKGFLGAWKKLRKQADPRYYYGIGYGADMNGFGGQGAPRNGPNPVSYPFKALDPGVTVNRNVTGARTWDINKDGVAQYGLYPDWIEDLRKQGGDPIVEDLARGAESYLQMWERAEGIAPHACRNGRLLKFSKAGLGRVKIGNGPEPLLRAAGQPTDRIGRTWSYCVNALAGKPAGTVRAVFTPKENVALISSTAARHRALGVGRGSKVTAKFLARTRASKVSGVRIFRAAGNRRYLFKVRRGKIAWVAVASPTVTNRGTKTLRAYLKLASLS